MADQVNPTEELIRSLLQDMLDEMWDAEWKPLVFGDMTGTPRGIGEEYVDHPGPAPTDGAGETLDG